MKLFSLALKNIKKCRGDYSIYFFTLIVGVAIFYMFNAIGSQEVMQRIARSGNENVQRLRSLIGVVSVMVAFVLGLLIIYANNFLIKRRKKEFGIYMLLGMGKKKVSRILICETCLVGLISLGVGLIAGIFGSQFLSILVCRMFEVDVTGFMFVISGRAILMTIISFLVIFLVIMLFNTGTVAKNNLIDLIRAEKKNEKHILKNKTLSVVLFVISCAALATVLCLMGFFGNRLEMIPFFSCIAVGIVGTFLLFWSAAGFLQEALGRAGSFYRKDLNSFVVRQFTGNINTSASSLALITLILFVALTFFSTGFSIRTYLNKRLGNATPVDVTMFAEGADALDLMAQQNVEVDEMFDFYLNLPFYTSKYITIGGTLGEFKDKAAQTFRAARWDARENVMKLSDYNALERKYGRDELKLDDDQYAIVCDFDLLNPFNEEALKAGTKIDLGGRVLSPGYDKPIEEYIMMSGMTAYLGCLVVPDAVVEDADCGFIKEGSVFAGDYREKGREISYALDEELSEKLRILSEPVIREDGRKSYPLTMTLKNEIKDNSVGTSVIVVFLVLYIGIVFVIACAAIIALKVLSDSIDSIRKYEILTRIGADGQMKRKALFAQVMMNFLIPLCIASVYTWSGLSYIKGLLRAFGMVKMGAGIVMTTVIMLIIYGGYFITTYEGCKRIVKV
ncbi:MAG: ABC transporter permease [Lachnospiraceae bacterium]|nr:ABC transporter permease [Lachnospiraceae bacterium]